MGCNIVSNACNWVMLLVLVEMTNIGVNRPVDCTCHVDAMISAFECFQDVCSRYTCSLSILSIDVFSALNWVMKSECRGRAWLGWWVSHTRRWHSIPTWWTSSMARPWKVPSLGTTSHTPTSQTSSRCTWGRSRSWRSSSHTLDVSNRSNCVHHSKEDGLLLHEVGWLDWASFVMSLATFRFGAWET